MAAAATWINPISTSSPSSASSRQPTKVPLNHFPNPRRRRSGSNSFPSLISTPRKPRTSLCLCQNSDREPEETATFLSEEDVNYIWKLVAGSVAGAVIIKYGSICFPEITRPNTLQALAMVSAPVLASVLVLIKESSMKNERKDHP